MGSTGIVIRVEKLGPRDARGSEGALAYETRWEQFENPPPQQQMVQGRVMVPVYLDVQEAVTDSELGQLDVEAVANELLEATLVQLLSPRELAVAAPINRSAPVGSATNPVDGTRNRGGLF